MTSPARIKATAVLIRRREGDQVIPLPEPMLPGQLHAWVRKHHGSAGYWPVMTTSRTATSKRSRKGRGES